jgi:hypothetical protein
VRQPAVPGHWTTLSHRDHHDQETRQAAALIGLALKHHRRHRQKGEDQATGNLEVLKEMSLEMLKEMSRTFSWWHLAIHLCIVTRFRSDVRTTIR